MQVTVFGASGKVGRLVVKELLDTGHTVVAFTHHASPFEADASVKTVQGDIGEAPAVAMALEGSAAVISALGSWGTKSKDIVSRGTSRIVPAMEKAGISRIITVTGSDARAAGDKLGLAHRLTHGLGSCTFGVRRIIKDSEDHIRMLEASKLEWTVIRSPIMNERGDPKNFYLAATRPKPWATINRHAVATALVAMIGNPDYSRQAPFIRRA